MVESDAQQKIGVLRPIGAVESMQAKEQKRPGKKLQTMSLPNRGRSQQQKTGGQAHHAFQNRGSPMDGGKSLGPACLDVIDRGQN